MDFLMDWCVATVTVLFFMGFIALVGWMAYALFGITGCMVVILASLVGLLITFTNGY